MKNNNKEEKTRFKLIAELEKSTATSFPETKKHLDLR